MRIAKSYHGSKHLTRCVGCGTRPGTHQAPGARAYEGWLIRTPNGVALTCQPCFNTYSPRVQAKIQARATFGTHRPSRAA